MAKSRNGNNGSPDKVENISSAGPDAARAVLAAAVQALRSEQSRLDALTQGQDRAQDQRHALYPRIREAEEALAEAQAHEVERLANSFISGDTAAPSPLPALQQNLDGLNGELAANKRADDAIAHESAVCQRRIERCHAAVAAALANVICGADSFHALYSERSQLFSRIRGIRKCLSYIRSQCHGQMPSDLHERVDLVETMEFDRTGVPVDDGPLEVWAQALSNLLEDPTGAPLPGDR